MIEKWFEDAWEMYKNNVIELAALMIITVIIGVVAVFVGIGVGIGATFIHPVLGAILLILLFSLVVVFVGPYLQAVMVSAYVDTADGKKVDIFGAVRKGTEYWKAMVVVTIIMLVAIGLPLVAGVITGVTALKTGGGSGIVAGPIAVVGFGLLALYMWIRLVWAPIIVVKRRAEGTEAIRESWRITSKDFWTAVKYICARILVGIVGGIITLVPFVGAVVSALFVSPYGGVLYARAAQDALREKK